MAKALSGASWSGVLRDAAGSLAGDATVRLRITSGEHDYTARTSPGGKFAGVHFAPLAADWAPA
jgi:hypothetical protein